MNNNWKIFKRFLKDKKVFWSYLYNFNAQSETRKRWFSTIGVDEITEFEPMEYLNFSFNWGNTKQGHIFWSSLESKWAEYCETNNLKK